MYLHMMAYRSVSVGSTAVKIVSCGLSDVSCIGSVGTVCSGLLGCSQDAVEPQPASRPGRRAQRRAGACGEMRECRPDGRCHARWREGAARWGAKAMGRCAASGDDRDAAMWLVRALRSARSAPAGPAGAWAGGGMGRRRGRHPSASRSASTGLRRPTGPWAPRSFFVAQAACVHAVTAIVHT